MTKETDKHISLLIKMISNSFRKRLDCDEPSRGMTVAQGRIIGLVAHHPGAVTPKELGEIFHLSPPTVTGILKRMERKKLIRLAANPADHRSKLVELAAAGREQSQQMHERLISSEQILLRGLSKAEREQLTGYLKRLLNNLREEEENDQDAERPDKAV